MWLKAAYFSLLHSETDQITWSTHIQPAIQRGKMVHGIVWPSQGAGHNVKAWAELLVLERAATPNLALTVHTGQAIQTCGLRIGQLWKESLRYHNNLAYQYEVTTVRLATEWLLANLDSL